MQADLTSDASWKAGLRRYGLEHGRPLKSTVEIDVSAEERLGGHRRTGKHRALSPFLRGDGSGTMARNRLA